MRKLFFLIIILLHTFIFAQDSSKLNYTISGKIIDANSKEPIEYATVIFKNNQTNNIQFGGITNQRGHFSIDVEKGFYTITVEFLSYATKTLELTEINQNLNIGTVEMLLTTNELDEVEISSKTTALSIQQNKHVYNVGKDLSQSNASATEILTNIPSVAVGDDGGITIKGQGNVTVLIDGKISSLSKADALKSLPANAIEKIEVISNPGASYRASATGIINILLKKGKNEGLNASVTGSLGYKEAYGGLITLNHKSKKVNFYTTTSYAHSLKNTLIDVDNEYFTNGITTGFLEENTLIKSPSNDFMLIAGAQFYLSDNSTLEASTKFDDIARKPFYTTNSAFFDASQTPTSNNLGINNSTFDNQIIEFSLDFKHTFKNEGQELNSYITFTKDKEQYTNNFSNTNPAFIAENYSEDNTLKNTEVSLKYTHPLNDSSGLAMGYLGTFGETFFDLYKETFEENITYQDHIHGVFVEYEKYWDLFYAGFGLRAEFTNLTTVYENTNNHTNNSFNDLFPTVYFEYTLKENKSLSLSYSRTIERPGYFELRPYEQKISETVSYIGNINLQPVYINSTNLGYTYYGDKLVFTSSLYWNNYENLIQPITFETIEISTGIPKIISTVENIGTLNMYGISATADLQAKDWLNFIGNANLYQMEQTGLFEYTNNNEVIIKDFESAGISGNFSLLTKIKIPKLFDFQFNIINSLKSEGAYSTKYANTYVNFAINKDLFNNNASISFNIDDVFNSKETNRTWFENNYTSKRLIAEKYQTIMLSFTYRFNQHKENRSINFDKKQPKIKL